MKMNMKSKLPLRKIVMAAQSFTSFVKSKLLAFKRGVISPSFTSSVKPKLQTLKGVVTNQLLAALVSLASLAIAIWALNVAIETLRSANEQFKQNAAASDSLFKVQLASSKELNDSLIAQIAKLQEITRKQMDITDHQLQVSVETYKAQLYSGRPVITLGGTLMKDTSFVTDGIFSPVILTQYSNVGLRHADSLRARAFIVYADFTGIRGSAGFRSLSEQFEPSAQSIHVFKPKIPVEYKNEFYYCIEFSYYDRILKQTSKYPFYFHYYKDRNTYSFYSCDDAAKPRVRNKINEVLGSAQLPLLDE